MIDSMITPETATTALELAGTAAGALGVGVAVYLQLIAPNRVPVWYVAAFFLFGAFMLVDHPGGVGLLEPTATLVRLAATVAALAVETGGALYVLRHLDECERLDRLREADLF